MIDRARSLLGAARRIVAFSGAGLSAESGISTFRDAGGLWSKHDPMRLASPQGFADDPALVIKWYAWRRRKLAEAQPNPAHIALARRPDIVHVTQNVDDLYERAQERAPGPPPIHLHGSIADDRCHAGCGFVERVDLRDPPPLRDCPRCGAAVRPAVVWFGESLPPDAWSEAHRACTTTAALLVIGTSAAVYPAAGLIEMARSCGAAIVVVNTEPTGAGDTADLELIGPAGELVPRILEGTEGLRE